MNIIITNVGRRGYLAEYIKAIKDFDGKVYVSDCDRTASGLYGMNDGHFILPRPVDDEKKYVEQLISLCLEYEISAVIPVIDPEIYILSGYREEFERKGITVVVSERRVLDICFDKVKMNEFLESIDVAYPATFLSLEEFEKAYDEGRIGFPVVLKPILGSGSVDTYFVDDKAKLCSLFKEGMMIQEKLEGAEFGTDTFNSFDGEPLRCVIKKKLLMRSGETDKSISVHSGVIRDTLISISKKLGHIANLDCDIILKDNTPYVIDMNPRFGGGYPATHTIGVNLVEILFKLLNGLTIKPEFDDYPENIIVMKTISVTSMVWKEGDII